MLDWPMTLSMENRGNRGRRRAGFTLVELVITVAIIGVLAAIAIPMFLTYQLRTKTSEVKTNLSAIRILEEGSFTEYGAYLAAAPEPAAVPGSQPGAFDDVNSDFAPLGFAPEGRVYFSYGIAISIDGAGFTADAAADIDADGLLQFWGYAKADGTGVRVAGEVGCAVTGLALGVVGPCTPSAGTSVF